MCVAKFFTLTCTDVAVVPLGAVYRPDDVIVPVVAEPPCTLFMSQIGPATGSLAAALNCTVCPGSSTAEAGEITGTCAGGSPRLLLLQPETKSMIAKTKHTRRIRGRKLFNSIASLFGLDTHVAQLGFQF
jgi:hypothetical protein